MTHWRLADLHRRVLVAEAVAELSHQAISADQPDELLRESLRVAIGATGADYGTAVRLLPEGYVCVAEELGPEPLPPGTILPLPKDKSYVMRVIGTAQPFVSHDLGRDHRITPPTLLLRRGIVSGVAVPVRGPQAVMGVLALHSRRRRRFGRDNVAVATALASVVATAWEQAEQRARLSHQALHEPLTGLPNRALFLNRLNQALAGRSSLVDACDPLKVAVMLIDLDDFKGVNDTFGHAAGDEVLKITAQRFKTLLRPEDTIARLGGDEFGLLCVSIPDEDTAIALAWRMQAASAQPINIAGSSVGVNASFGITWGVDPAGKASAPAVLLDEADVALYRAKSRGRGEIQVFDNGLRRSIRHRRQLEADLKTALERKEFRLHYQPVRRAEDLHTLGVEALVRWQHPTRGLIGPDEFIPVAEQTGLIAPLGEWILRTALEQAVQWQQTSSARSSAPFWVAVNVSPRQLDDPQLPDMVTAALRDTALSAGTLVLELTESALMPTDTSRRDTLERLRDLGAQLFLDDFGTGYSSLTHLTQLPIQAVKIDRSFVAGLPTNQRNAAVVSALIGLSADLDLQVIAEGVESPQQLQALQLMDCQAVQGYLLGSPDPDPMLALPPLITETQSPAHPG
jgi:diguanylate cyclase (GGDEF)-like protein